MWRHPADVRLYDRSDFSTGKEFFLLYEAKTNQVKGKTLSAELFGLKILVKLR
jgi:hypothetical protein